MQGKPEEALPHFEAAAAAAPGEARYTGNVALALGVLGRYDESLARYRTVLSEADARYNVEKIRQMGLDGVMQPKVAAAAPPS